MRRERDLGDPRDPREANDPRDERREDDDRDTPSLRRRLLTLIPYFGLALVLGWGIQVNHEHVQDIKVSRYENCKLSNKSKHVLLDVLHEAYDDVPEAEPFLDKLDAGYILDCEALKP